MIESTGGLLFGRICQLHLPLAAPLETHIHNTASPCFTVKQKPVLFTQARSK